MSYSLYQMMLHFFQLDSFEVGRDIGYILHVVLTLFSFWILFYFRSLVKTELVVIDDPDIIRTWRDIIDRGVKLLFPKGGYYHFSYMNADEGSIKHELWKYAIKKYGKDKILLAPSKKNLFPLFMEVVNGNTVLMSDTFIASVGSKSFCEFRAKNFSRLMEGGRHLTYFANMADTQSKDLEIQPPLQQELPAYMNSVDPSAESMLKGNMISEFSHKNPAMAPFFKQFKILLEMGILRAFFYKVQRVSILKNAPPELSKVLGPTLIEKTSSVHDCYSETPVKPEVKLYGVTFDSLKSLLKLCTGLILFAAFILMMENNWDYLTA